METLKSIFRRKKNVLSRTHEVVVPMHPPKIGLPAHLMPALSLSAYLTHQHQAESAKSTSHFATLPNGRFQCSILPPSPEKSVFFPEWIPIRLKRMEPREITTRQMSLPLPGTNHPGGSVPELSVGPPPPPILWVYLSFDTGITLLAFFLPCVFKSFSLSVTKWLAYSSFEITLLNIASSEIHLKYHLCNVFSLLGRGPDTGICLKSHRFV